VTQAGKEARVVVGRIGLTAVIVALGGASSGCASDASHTPRFEPEVTLGDSVPTVATVRWSAHTDEFTEAHVEFGPTDAYGDAAPVVEIAGGELEAVVVGLKPDTTYHLRAVVDRGGDVLTSADREVTTGSVPPALAELTLDPDHHDPLLADDGFLITATIPGRATIVDADGDRVWWHGAQLDAHNCTTRAYLSRDGSGVVYLTWVSFSLAGAHSDVRQLIRTRFDGEDVERIEVPAAHHDFVELPDGTLTVLQFDELPVEPEGIYGDRLVELHPDGSDVEVWRLWDAWEFSMGDVHEDGSRWGHSNAVDYDPTEDAYYVSTLYMDTIFKIDRATGDVIWRLGGPASDFELTTGDDGWFDGQHQFQLTEGGIVVFDNGPYAVAETRIVEYALDHDAMTAELIWTHRPDPPLGIYAYGDVSRLDSGNTLVTWAAAGRAELVTPAGEVVWRLGSELGAAFGYGSWVDSLYR